jgi:hypothetical protein
MCTVLLPPGDNPIAVNKYIIFYVDFISLAAISPPRSSCKVLDIFARFLSNLNFLNRVPQKFSVYNFTEIRPVGTLLIRADGRTDTTKLISAFRDYVNET